METKTKNIFNHHTKCICSNNCGRVVRERFCSVSWFKKAQLHVSKYIRTFTCLFSNTFQNETAENYKLPGHKSSLQCFYPLALTFVAVIPLPLPLPFPSLPLPLPQCFYPLALTFIAVAKTQSYTSHVWYFRKRLSPLTKKERIIRRFSLESGLDVTYKSIR